MTEIPKYIQSWMKNVSFPTLLILKEKHETRYLYAEDMDELQRHAVSVVRERREEGQYTAGKRPESPGMTKETAEALPPGPIRSAAVREIGEYKFSLMRYEKELREEALSFEVDDDHLGGQAAIVLLRDRKCYEYEGFELVQPERATV